MLTDAKNSLLCRLGDFENVIDIVRENLERTEEIGGAPNAELGRRLMPLVDTILNISAETTRLRSVDIKLYNAYIGIITGGAQVCIFFVVLILILATLGVCCMCAVNPKENDECSMFETSIHNCNKSLARKYAPRVKELDQEHSAQRIGLHAVGTAWVLGTIGVVILLVLFGVMLCWSAVGSDLVNAVGQLPHDPYAFLGNKACGTLEVPGGEAVSACDALPRCFANANATVGAAANANKTLAMTAIQGLKIRELDVPYMKDLLESLNATGHLYAKYSYDLDASVTLIMNIRTLFEAMQPTDFGVTQGSTESAYVEEHLGWVVMNMTWAINSILPIVTPSNQLALEIPTLRPYILTLIDRVYELDATTGCTWMGPALAATIAPTSRMFDNDGSAMAFNLLFASIFLAAWVLSAIKLQIRFGVAREESPKIVTAASTTKVEDKEADFEVTSATTTTTEAKVGDARVEDVEVV